MFSSLASTSVHWTNFDTAMHLWSYCSMQTRNFMKTTTSTTTTTTMTTWTCLVKRSRNQFGDRYFATAGPTLWNSLPEQLRQPDITFGQFKRSLKTLLYVCLVGPRRLVSER